MGTWGGGMLPFPTQGQEARSGDFSSHTRSGVTLSVLTHCLHPQVAHPLHSCCVAALPSAGH